MKTRVIQDEPDEAQPRPSEPTSRSPRPVSGRGSRTTGSSRSSCSPTLAWWAWPLYGLGIFSELMFFAIGPLLAALIVIAIAEGRPGFRDLGSRIIRWRVAWYWYAVAIGFPLAVRVRDGDGQRRSRWSAGPGVVGTGVVQLRDGVPGAPGQSDGRPARRGARWRGFALPRMQARTSPLVLSGDPGRPGCRLASSARGRRRHRADRPGVDILDHHLLRLAVQPRSGQCAADADCAQHAGQHHDERPGIRRRRPVPAGMAGVAWSIVAIGVIVLDRAAWQKAPREAVLDEG